MSPRDSVQRSVSIPPTETAEEKRLQEAHSRTANWQRWGSYLSERQWGTVREDYSESGNCWEYFTHEQARSRAYRWGEDGLLGICDRECRLCFGIALWNGRDSILKERLFGLTGPEGNHGEDVKDCYYYLDATPTHSYMKSLYKYPQAEFPYARLVAENRRRGKNASEFELADTGLFDNERYFDVTAEYAKASSDDILIRLTIVNRGPETASLDVLPTLWYRNTWSWGCTHEGCEVKPRIDFESAFGIVASHVSLGIMHMVADVGPDGLAVPILFTENETNMQRLFGIQGSSPFAKDAFHEYVIQGNKRAINVHARGTKAAWHHRLLIRPGGEVTLRLRLTADHEFKPGGIGADFASVFASRIAEADEFYATRIPNLDKLSTEEAQVARQSIAGLLHSKQFYHLVVRNWLDGDPEQPTPPPARRLGRNHEWTHLFNRDLISMPDKWEYPWYAAWDLAFHMIPMARVDGEFAKSQLLLFLREWYMHPNGQIPAYEFSFGDVNPPVHAWACWRVYKITGSRGKRDRLFLRRAFHKLLINFTWWVNRKDPQGRNLFSGGFLGLDNIGVFDRSQALPTGGTLEQADGTAWMGFYCATMLSMALELAADDPSYEDIASKFFEHFVAITDAMNSLGGTGLWDEEDGFYYDMLSANGATMHLKIRSMVGIIPLFAVEVLEQDVIDRLPGFKKRLEWFLIHRQDLARHIAYLDSDPDTTQPPGQNQRLLAMPSKERLIRVLRYVLDESEFLSPFGVRALSRFHQDHPFKLEVEGVTYCVDYEPGESKSGLFGGNSNWRGPIWFPVNYLLIESLERYYHFYGESLLVECPVGSGTMMNLKQVAQELSARLVRLFLPDANGRRPCHGVERRYAQEPAWRDLLLFHEYFHGDSGRGLGASHQTGWTALIAQLLIDVASDRARSS